jgi:hypothetical protein
MIKCVHFRGIQNVCRAGIDPRTKRDTTKPGIAVFPCLTFPGNRPCGVACGSRREMTPAEVAAEDAEIEAAVARMEQALAAGNCPHCLAPIERRQVVGRCAYARPCGHRLGQVGGDEP